MVVYFENSYGDLIKVGNVDGRKSSKSKFNATMNLVYEFCERRGYNIPYSRFWTTELQHQAATQIDVGSHTEFFYTVPNLDMTSITDITAAESK